MENPLLEGKHKVPHTPCPKVKAATPQDPGLDVPSSLGGCPWEAGDDCGSDWGRKELVADKVGTYVNSDWK